MPTATLTDAADATSLLGASVYDRLRRQVLSGELAPGEALSVPRLAAALDVSRSPVREAVQQLIWDGLAVHVPFAGATVVRVGRDELRAVLRVREPLDGLAAAEAAVRARGSELDTLADVLAEQRSALEHGPDPERDSASDLRFHQLVREAARNVPLSQASGRLEAIAHLHGTALWASDRNRRLAVAEHAAVLDALESGDADRARRAAEAHVAGLLVRMDRT